MKMPSLRAILLIFAAVLFLLGAVLEPPPAKRLESAGLFCMALALLVG